MPTSASEVPAAQFDSIDDTIAAFKNGEFIIVLDSPDRENEGDLIISASHITPEQMAFMVRYTSGLICAPTTPSILSKFNLPQMVTENADPKGTAYTISIDASHASTTTGISAQDRALTCRVLASPSASSSDLRSPGHVLPLRAREGGVRVRPGHTEAAVEFCRLAGLPLVAVIAELVEDGESVEGRAEFRGPGMMRTEGCLSFARKFGLRCCTIEGLVEWVEKREGKWVEKNGVNDA